MDRRVTAKTADWTSALAGGPILVFGGPYSNLRATQAMRAEADRLGIPANHVICTGDVVAYAAEPEGTTQLIIDWGCHVIAGNCEEQIGAGASDCGCGFEEGTACDVMAKGWYPFANMRVSDASRAWMRGLPARATFTIGGLTVAVVHGGVNQTNKFIFASEAETIAAELADAGTDVVIGGHAGVPFATKSSGRLWFNPGVIGMPANDGTPDVWYGLIALDGDAVTFTLKRLAYDHAGAAAAMRRWAHADGYAKTLVTGIWPSFDVFPAVEKAQTGKRIRARSWSLPRRDRFADAAE